ncbi:MAG: Glyoxylate/hydroxypyruvate reductase B [Candidatus Dichloromethanomonas elyunquensis]|nr:MAG: Glyoxylate/hydroxypyruvate reductase B [Candidatus Dichloromethanomonas elyunquensis]
MKPKVFITRKVAAEVKEYIAKYCDFRMWDSEDPIPRQVLLQEVPEIDGLLNHTNKIDDELLGRALKLKVVSNMSSGYNNFDIEAMKRRKIIATNTPGVLDETVADNVMALILASARRIPELDRYVKEGKWDKLIGEDLFGTDVHDTALGIIGMGRIGKAIAYRAKFGFHMRILYHNQSNNLLGEQELGARFCSLDQLLQESDFVLITTPLTDKTRNMIGAREFSLMKDSAIFVNASRGETVDESALYQALKNGVIRAAALDVYAKEPVDPNNPLLQLNNIVTVPHIGSAVKETRDAMALLGAENLVKALQGEEPPNLIDEFRII